MSRYVQSNDEKSWVNQSAVKEDTVDVMFDIEDKKVVKKLRDIMKAWSKADIEVRKRYAEKEEGI